MKKSLVIKAEIAKLTEGQMLLICTSCGNPDHGQYAPLSELEAYVITSFEEASAASRAYIGMWDLGGGNWNGGQIYNTEGRIIAEVSYNGRVWQFHGVKKVEVELNAESREKFLTMFNEKYQKMLDDYMKQQGMPTVAEMFAE